MIYYIRDKLINYTSPIFKIGRKVKVMNTENSKKPVNQIVYVVVAHSVADDYWSSIDDISIFSKREDAEKEKERLEKGDHKGYPVEIFERVVNDN